ncbi:TolC family protein, partial [Amphritea sp.]|uniref:TolC family protein n=1 Tax=Amphritea sp. TaxID=1872502 RepID=UPI003567C2BF
FNGLGQVGASNTRAAEARYQATLDDLAFTQNTIVRDVDTLLSDLETAEALAQGQVDVIDSLSDTLTSYERQYDSGFKSWLDLLNMQRELTEQKLQLVLFENQQVQARAILTAMTGGFDAIAGIGHAQSQTRVKER